VKVASAVHAARIATISACAVGSLVDVTRFTPSAMMRPSRATTAPKGPPMVPSSWARDKAIARRMRSWSSTGPRDG